MRPNNEMRLTRCALASGATLVLMSVFGGPAVTQAEGGWLVGKQRNTTTAQTGHPVPESSGRQQAGSSISEDDVKRSLQTWLQSAGWSVKVASGHEHGIDIDAGREDRRWIIEVKGEGTREQMRGNFFLGALGELLQRMDDPQAQYSIALPDLPQYRGLWQRLPTHAKERTRISALFVSGSGQVEEVR